MPQNNPYKVGSWQVEPELNRLSREDEEVIVVPKVMALLQVLVEHQGEPLSQDRLIELVWPGQVVSDSSVYQAVAQLRKAFGDSASQAQYIERISGKGYRLVAEVTEVAPVQQVQQTRHNFFAFSAVSLCLLLFAMWFWLNRDEPQSLIDSRISSVTFIDLTLQEQADSQSLRGFNQVLLSQLTQFEGLKVVHAKTLPEHINTQSVLWGTIAEHNQQMQVFLQLHNAADNSVLWAQRFEAPKDQLYQLQNRVIDGLLNKLERKQSLTTFDDKRSFEQYLLARHLWQQRNVDALLQSQSIYEQMRDDGQLFPLAAVGLCETYHFLHIYSDWTLKKALSMCEPLLEQALKAEPELGEAMASKALLLANQGKREEAEAMYKQALEYSPNYAFGLMWYGNLIRDLGQYDKALQVTRKAFELAPMSPVINRSLAYSHLTLSRFSDARYYYQRALSIDPNYFLRPVQALDFLPLSVERANDFLRWHKDNTEQLHRRPYDQVTLAQIELSLGKTEQATARFQSIDHDRINPAFLLYMKAAIETVNGNLAAAAELLQQRMAFHPDKRRFIMPYLSNLHYRGEHETVYQKLMQFMPELATGNIEITKDNQYMVVFYLYVQHSRGLLHKEHGLLARMDKWFTDNPPMYDHYYAQWLVFRQDPKAAEVLTKMLDEGWLPDFNEDMQAIERVRQMFEVTGLGVETFRQKLARNRSITLNYISDHFSTDPKLQ